MGSQAAECCAQRPSPTGICLPFKSMAQAMETVWGQPPLFKREGGSIPVVAMLQDNIGAESILCGSGLPEDNVHAPNERLHLPTWYKGIDALIHFFYNLG